MKFLPLIVPFFILLPGCAQYYAKYGVPPEKYGVMYKICSTDMLSPQGQRVSAIVADYGDHYSAGLSTGDNITSPTLSGTGSLSGTDEHGYVFEKHPGPVYKMKGLGKIFTFDCSHVMLKQRVNASGRPVSGPL